jgi:hypothetical protein
MAFGFMRKGTDWFLLPELAPTAGLSLHLRPLGLCCQVLKLGSVMTDSVIYIVKPRSDSESNKNPIRVLCFALALAM